MKRNYFLKHISKYIKQLILCFTLLIVITGLSILPGILTRNIFDKGILMKDFRYIIYSVSLLLIIYLLKVVTFYICNKLNIKITQTILSNVYKELISRILKLPMEFFKDKESGYILSRLNEVNQLSSLLSLSFFQSIISLFQFMGIYIILFITNYKITLIFTILIPLFSMVPKYYNKKLINFSQNVFEKSSVLQGKVIQAIKGIEEIKTFSLEYDKSKELNENIESLKIFQIKQANIFSISSVFLSGLNNISSILILFVCSYFVLGNTMSIGTYIMFSIYIPLLYSNIQTVTSVIVNLKPTILSFKRIESFFYEIDEEDSNHSHIINKINNIAIKDLSFKYEYDSNYIINNLNLTINCNDKVLITGKNGSGKTTLLRLLLGLYTVDTGEILINGVNINTINRESLRKSISTVSQKIYLFNDSIKNNIICNSKASYEEYRNVLDVVNLTNFIDSLEFKDSTLVGENGVKLSGGQIQKIAIARALLKNSDIFLFDEFLSNLDTESISLIKNLLENILKNKTCIFIEHQPVFTDFCNKTINI